MSDPRDEPTRRPVGVAVSPYGTVVAVCDDGSVWRIVGEDRWTELAPIPGTARAAVDSGGAA